MAASLAVRIHRANQVSKALWALSCKHDNIPVTSKLVTFSDKNPYEKRLNAASQKLQTLLAERAQENDRGRATRKFFCVLP